ncbi:AI-2E family transporter [Pedobacter sp. JCM 36344]|uniref:AI-2E family transporter n=1 Tax=Pedobacter sp. JCM 36344 TaxID=3374280 RepID=UPI003979BEF9
MPKLQQSVYILFFLFLSFAGLYFGDEFLIPVALAAVFSMLFIRFCNWMESKGLKRGLASFICIVVFLISVLAIILLMSWQLSSLSENMDEMKNRLIELLNNTREWLSRTIGISFRQQEKIINQQSPSGASTAGSIAMGFASGTFGLLVNSLLVMVYMYLFLFYRSHIKNFILKLANGGDKNLADEIVHKSGKVAQKYLSGLGAMILVLWIMYGIGFSLVGVENAIFFAVLCGILEIVPFVGNLIGTSLTILSVVAQGGDAKMIVWVLVTYFVVQFIQTYILEPLVVGEQVSINSLFTIMSIVVGEMVWGVAGMILAIPLLGIVKIICDNVPDLQPYGFLIGPAVKKEKRRSLIYRFKRKTAVEVSNKEY